MSERFEISLNLNEATGIFRVVATGPMDSDAFVDPQLELFSKLPRPWVLNITQN